MGGGPKSRGVSQIASTAPKILIVDDMSANLLALEAVLEPIGVPVVSATSGEDALREILRHGDEIAVMLLDVQMPGLDGFQTAKLIRSRENARHLPIIFITAISREEAHIVKGYANDAVDYIVKPFNADVLRSKVKYFVEVHRRVLALERERQLSEHRLELALESADLGVWGWEAATNRVTCDARCRALLGLSAEAPLDLATFGVEEAQVSSEGKLRVEHSTDAGKCLLVQARVHGSESRAEMVGVVADITDERRALEEREMFLGVLGHDLRNPLNVIAIGADTLSNHQDSSVVFSATKMAKATRRMSVLISDVLDFVRSRIGDLPIKPCAANLNTICEDVIDEVRAAHRDALIEFNPGEAADGNWDPARVSQIVQNLITNAVRHADPAHAIRVAVGALADGVVLDVENVGAPIPPEVRARIFEPFVSAAGEIGLGLYIAKRLVSAHGGEIAASSDDGRTMFRVTLPRRAEA